MLMRSVRALLDDPHGTVQLAAQFDVAIVKRRQPKLIDGTLVLGVGAGTIERLNDKDTLKWLLEDDEAEYLLDRLTEYESLGYFSPAEFVQVRCAKRTKLDTIYFGGPHW